MCRPPLTFVVMLLTAGCWQHRSGGGQEHQLTFSVAAGPTSLVQLNGPRPGDVSGPGFPVSVTWQEVRQNPLAAGLHSGGGWQYRAVPLDVRDAFCEPATLCTVTVRPSAPGAKLVLQGLAVGQGQLVVRGKLSWWRSISDRLPVTVLPPRS